MNSRLKPFREEPIPRHTTKFIEPDRIPGTTKIRTYTANASLYSKESSLDKLIRRAQLCSDNNKEKQI